MRFDDRVTTVLEGPYDTPRARAARWQQLTDIVAQAGPSLKEPVAVRLLRLIALLARDVPAEQYCAHAKAVAARSEFAPLLVLLAGHNSAAAEAVIPAANLPDEGWLSAMPQLSPFGRALMRQRENLSPKVARALQFFAAGDMTIGYTAAVESTGVNSAADIRDLVRRIEEYRQRQRESGVAGAGSAQSQIDGQRIAFATDSTARIVDAETRFRGQFVGIDLGQPAAAFETGCDAGTARIIAKRGRVDAGRLLIQGQGMWAGTWLCEAEPYFSAENGAFSGYTGILRRPLPHEVVAPKSPVAEQSDEGGFKPELLRQLMHELRSPLNAISGFAQMIEGQYAGPVAATYVAAAQTILAETASLNDVIDDIDLLAQMSGGRTEAQASSLMATLQIVADTMREARCPVDLIIDVDDSDADLQNAVAPDEFGLILHLWLQPLAREFSQEGLDQLHVSVQRNSHAVQLIAQGYPGEDHEASAGRGFAFPAAAELASQAGGKLLVQAGQYILNLPLVIAQPSSGEMVG